MVRLNRAISDETHLRRELGHRLGIEVTGLNVQEVNLVNDTTLVEVRFNRAEAPQPATTTGLSVVA
nr:DUF4956 domain-containing protein [Tessaracoccus coleopterorum]